MLRYMAPSLLIPPRYTLRYRAPRPPSCPARATWAPSQRRSFRRAARRRLKQQGLRSTATLPVRHRQMRTMVAARRP